MAANREFWEIARQVADRAQLGGAQPIEKISDFQNGLTQAKSQRDAARLASQRLLDYRVSIEHVFQCPKCWILEGIETPLRPTVGTRDQDIFRCERCGVDFAIAV